MNCPGIDIAVYDDESPVGMVYIIPRNNDTVVIGGTYEDVKFDA